MIELQKQLRSWLSSSQMYPVKCWDWYLYEICAKLCFSVLQIQSEALNITGLNEEQKWWWGLSWYEHRCEALILLKDNSFSSSTAGMSVMIATSDRKTQKYCWYIDVCMESLVTAGTFLSAANSLQNTWKQNYFNQKGKPFVTQWWFMGFWEDSWGGLCCCQIWSLL